MMPFLTDDDLKGSVKAFLKVKASEALPTYWDEIITRSNDSAYQDIVGVLLGRGYTMSQISTWDRREEFNRDIGMFWALTRGMGAHDYSDIHIMKLDRRKELQTVALQTSNEQKDPERIEGIIVSGTLDDEDDLYTRESFW